MRGFKTTITDSQNNTLYIVDLESVFNVSGSHICKLIRNYKISTLKHLVKTMGKPRKAHRQATLIEGKYRLRAVGHMFNRSNSWATQAYNHHNCRTIADFALRDKLANARPKEDTKTTIDIEDIPVGTWEAKHITCPPANKKSPQQVFKEIRIEEMGAIKHNDFIEPHTDELW